MIADDDRQERGLVWQAIGGLQQAVGKLQGTVDSLLEGQREIKADQRDLGKKVDRLLFAVIAVGGTVGGSVIALLILEILSRIE